MNMSDTSAEASQLQVKSLQAKTSSERLALTLTLSNTVISLSRRAIKRTNPGFSDSDVHCQFVELHYGKQLADELRQYFLKLADG